MLTLYNTYYSFLYNIDIKNVLKIIKILYSHKKKEIPVGYPFKIFLLNQIFNMSRYHLFEFNDIQYFSHFIWRTMHRFRQSNIDTCMGKDFICDFPYTRTFLIISITYSNSTYTLYPGSIAFTIGS